MHSVREKKAIVVGAGPAGLMAAEQLALAGLQVDVYDAMPSAGRKFLLAGKSGMNLTHDEAQDQFLQRYGNAAPQLIAAVQTFDAKAIRAWTDSLGIATFVGSSGRVFPVDMKAAPLLRAWLHRLRELGVKFHMRHRWLDWCGDALVFEHPSGETEANADCVVFALGGASWARLGSDGLWAEPLRKQGARLVAFEPANCGFEIAWSGYFREKFAGSALKTVGLRLAREAEARKGQFVLSEYGVEGSLIYAHSREIRTRIKESGHCDLYLDLLPDRSLASVQGLLTSSRGSRSWASHLKSKLGLQPVQIALLHECLEKSLWDDAHLLATSLKCLPLRLCAPRPIDEAISSAGGLSFDELDENFMLRRKPGCFFAGEMLDWEAPTGGYLLTACFSSGVAAGRGALAWLQQSECNAATDDTNQMRGSCE